MPWLVAVGMRTLVVAGRTILERGKVGSVDLTPLEAELLGQARAAWPDRRRRGLLAVPTYLELPVDVHFTRTHRR